MKLALIVGMCLLFASQTEAQSLDRVFNGPDRWWEAQQARHPVLYQLDNRNWKSWIGHAVVAQGVGRALGAVTPLSQKQGVRVMLGFYVVRETYNIFHDRNRKYGDSVMDVFVPYVVYRFTF